VGGAAQHGDAGRGTGFLNRELESSMSQVTCSSCRAERPSEVATQFPRSPCACGATALTVHAEPFEAALTLTDTVSVTLTPGDQDRGWRRRWRETQHDLQQLIAPRTTPLSAEAIHAAAQQLLAFFVQTYHIKDALKKETSATGVAPGEVENVVKAEPHLALLADLANLVKHASLDVKKYPPKSGHVPSIISVAGESVSAPAGAWRLRLTIEHAGRTLDGLEIARDAVETWRRRLSSWKLI
jgi:hypothetical protein